MKENFNLDLFVNNFKEIINGYFYEYEADHYFNSVDMYFHSYISEYLAKKEFNTAYKDLSDRKKKFIYDILEEEYGWRYEGYGDIDEFVDYCKAVIEELKDAKPFKTDYYTECIERRDNINCIQNLANEIIQALCIRYFDSEIWIRSEEDLKMLLRETSKTASTWNLEFDIKEENKKNRTKTDKYYKELDEIFDKYIKDIFSLKGDIKIEFDLEKEVITQLLPLKYYRETKNVKDKIDEETYKTIDELKNRFIFVDLTKNKVIERV